MRWRVVLYHNVMAPYRHALFQAIAQHVDLDVWFSARTTRDRDWGTENPTGYAYRVLRSYVWYAFSRPLIVAPTLIREIDQTRPDALIAVLTRSNLIDVFRLVRVAQRRGIPVILWIGNVEYPRCFRDDLPSLLTKTFEAYYRYVIRRASGFMFYSKLSQQWAAVRGASGPAIIGTQVLEKSDAVPRLEVQNNEYAPRKMLFVGKLEKRKGFDILLDAISDLDVPVTQDLELIVAGTGPLASARPPQRSSVHVRYLGHVRRPELASLYRASDVLILPSRHDPWGFVVNEAMAMGTPVIASSACGAAELAAKSGWVFDPCRREDFLAQLRTALTRCRTPGIRRQAVAAEELYRPKSCAGEIGDLVNEIAVKA
jgi:glycosyltransferase involved in cell wall biosynthesis